MSDTRTLFVLPDIDTPSGGIRSTYRAAELLRDAGVDALVWHHRPGFRCTWFESTVPVVGGDTVEVGADDVVVVPEVLVLDGFDPAPGCRKVVYNHNPFYTFDNITPDSYPGWTDEPLHIWANSPTGRDVLALAFPNADVRAVPYWLDTDTFAPRPVRHRRIAYIPRKRERDASLVTTMLRQEPRLAGWDITPMVGMDEAQVAELLGTAAVFLAFGDQEGFVLPVAEAMASGCLVVGYAGCSGGELMHGPWARIVDGGDLLGFVAATVKAVEAFESGEAGEAGEAGRAVIVEACSADDARAALVQAVADAVRTISASPGRAVHPLTRVEAGPDPASTIAELEQLLASVPELRARLGKAEARVQALQDEASRVRGDLASLADHDTLAAFTHQEHLRLEAVAAELARTLTALDEVRRERDAARARIEAIEGSTSWRATAALRRLGSLARPE